MNMLTGVVASKMEVIATASSSIEWLNGAPTCG
jgi:hypothetical protein